MEEISAADVARKGQHEKPASLIWWSLRYTRRILIIYRRSANVSASTRGEPDEAFSRKRSYVMRRW